MKQLIESCRKAIAETKCTGCTACGEEDFIGNKDCEYSKTRTAEEKINAKPPIKRGFKFKKRKSCL